MLHAIASDAWTLASTLLTLVILAISVILLYLPKFMGGELRNALDSGLLTFTFIDVTLPIVAFLVSFFVKKGLGDEKKTLWFYSAAAVGIVIVVFLTAPEREVASPPRVIAQDRQLLQESISPQVSSRLNSYVGQNYLETIAAADNENIQCPIGEYAVKQIWDLWKSGQTDDKIALICFSKARKVGSCGGSWGIGSILYFHVPGMQKQGREFLLEDFNSPSITCRSYTRALVYRDLLGIGEFDEGGVRARFKEGTADDIDRWLSRRSV